MTYIAHTSADQRRMLDAVGVATIDDLFADVPAQRRRFRLNLPPALSELELQQHLRILASENIDTLQLKSYLGAGAYTHYIPAAVGALASRGEFSTSYTPYQPEVSQGTLQAMYEFQSMVCTLTSMEAANASVYDGATALTEATTMARNITNRDLIAVPRSLHPHYRSVLEAYRVPVMEVGADEGIAPMDPSSIGAQIDERVAAVVVPSPNVFGLLEDWTALSAEAHRYGALLIAVFHPIALGLLASPGSCDTDIAVGEGQPLGIPVSFGGPSLGLMATRSHFLRQLPGRIVGATVDRDGREGFVLTLRAREQDIRRERASSNICTNQSLMALQAAIYLSLVGREGLREIAAICAQRAHYLAKRISGVAGFSVVPGPFFNEFVVQCPNSADHVAEMLLAQGILAGFPLGQWYPELTDHLLVCVTEVATRSDLDAYVAALEGARL